MVRGFAHTVFRHKTAIGCCLGAALVAAGVASVGIEPAYRAEASLLVKVAGDGHKQDDVLGAQIALLKSADLGRRVVAILGVGALYPDIASRPPADQSAPEAATRALADDLGVTVERGAGVLRLSYDNADPEAAAQALNLLIELYRDKHTRLFAAPETETVLREVAHDQDELRQAQERLAAFRQQYKIYDADEQRQLLLRQRGDLDSDLRTAQNQASELQEKLRTLKDRLAQTPATIALSNETERSRSQDDARAKLVQLQLQEQELLGKYKDSSQFVVNVRGEIARVQALLKSLDERVESRARTGANEVYQDLEKELFRTEAALNAVHSRRAVIETQIADLDRRTDLLATRDKAVKDLDREVATAEAALKASAERAATLKVAETQGRIADIGVIAQAVPPTTTVRPRPALYLALALVAGLALGLAVAVLLEQVSSRFSTPQSVERRLKLPVLTSIAYKA